MPPQQTEEQRNRAFQDANITSTNLAETTGITEVAIPPPTDTRPVIDTALQGLQDQDKIFQEQQAQVEGESGTLQEEILKSIGTLGTESTRQAELEEEAELPGQRQELQGIINQLQTLSKASAAIPIQIQEEFKGRGVTAGGIEPIQTSRLRRNTIQALGLAAIGQTFQGNISLAEASIAKALEVEFEPERIKLQTLQQLYLFNKDALERVDKKRADNLNILLGERERLLNLAEADKKEVYNLGKLAAQFNAPTSVIQEALASSSREEALSILSPFLQDPQAKVQLQQAMLNTELTKLRITREAEELATLRRYGGMTPAQWIAEQNRLREEHEEDLEKAKQEGEEIDLAIVQGREITNDLNQVSAILNSSAIDTIVGTNILSRGVARQKGKFSTLISGLVTLPTGFLAGGIIDEARGADDVVSSIEQMTSTLFLDKLISVKGQGATFGQLSDREGAALRNAAQSISQTAIRDNSDKVVGYDMSEKEFRKQILIVQERLQFLYQKTTGDAFTSDEQAVFDAMNEASQTFNPAF